MPVTTPQWRFTEAMIEDAPDCRGVYVLWRHGKPVGVGHALGAYDTLRSRLLGHYAHARHSDLGITHYSWQICSDPLEREAQLSAQLGLLSEPDSPRDPSPTCLHAESGSSSSTT